MIKQTIKVIDLDAVSMSIAKLRTIKCTAVAVATMSLEETFLRHMEEVVKLKVQTPEHEDSAEYNKKYKEILVDNYAKDENGNVLKRDNRPMIKDVAHFNLEVGKLATLYPEYFEMITEYEDNYAKFIETEIVLEYADINIKHLSMSLSLDDLIEINRFWDTLSPRLQS